MLLFYYGKAERNSSFSLFPQETFSVFVLANKILLRDYYQFYLSQFNNC